MVNVPCIATRLFSQNCQKESLTQTLLASETVIPERENVNVTVVSPINVIKTINVIPTINVIKIEHKCNTNHKCNNF